MSSKKNTEEKETQSLTKNADNNSVGSSSGITTHEVTFLISIILLAWAIYYVFRKGMEKGSLKAQSYFDLKISELNQAQNRTMVSILDAQGRLSSTIERAKVIPDKHIQVPLEEGRYTYRLPTGYSMRVEISYDHRAVAEEALGRKLASNEVVHHIYGKNRDDNRPENLCVLDSDYHDLWHTFLDRELRVKGYYPKFSEQKWLLKTYYRGILIDESMALKTPTFPPIESMKKDSGFKIPNSNTNNQISLKTENKEAANPS